jgi:hypothetical protein
LLPVVLLVFIVAGVVTAQERRASGKTILKIRKLNALGTRSLVDTPSYRNNATQGTKRAKKWHEISVIYDTAPEWIDELTIEYHVLAVTIDKKTRKKKFSLYKSIVKYSDIEKGRGHVATAFLRPVALKRYGNPIAVATVFSVNGKVVAVESQESEKLPSKWWSDQRVIDRAEMRKGYLLDRAKSPWALVDYDDYEVIK